MFPMLRELFEIDIFISMTERHILNSISASANGWTDGGIALEWLKVCFDAQTKEKAAGAPRVLLMDGHSSHYTPELLKYARDNNNIILGYLPHCTHALQGLDVVCFARMKEAWKEEIRKLVGFTTGNPRVGFSHTVP